MHCVKASTSIFRKLDDELSKAEQEELAHHLRACSSCARQMKLLMLPRRIGQVVPAFEPPPFFYRRLRARLDAELRSVPIWQIILGLSRQVIPSLATITIVLLSIFVYQQLQVSEADDIYQAYDMIFMSGDRPQRMVIADHAEITDESVLRAIAEDDMEPAGAIDLQMDTPDKNGSQYSHP